MRKFFTIILIIAMFAVCMSGCETTYTATEMDTIETLNVMNKLQGNQPMPTDIDYSLERYNLIRRAYWVNGMREKANMLPCEVEKPLGYIVLFTEGGGIVGSFIVDGKVSSLNSFLTPDSMYYEVVGTYMNDEGDAKENEWLADVDGSYGNNDNGIFFFTPDGKYVEWTGIYLYSDIPMIVGEPVIKFDIG